MKTKAEIVETYRRAARAMDAFGQALRKAYSIMKGTCPYTFCGFQATLLRTSHTPEGLGLSVPNVIGGSWQSIWGHDSRSRRIE